MSFINTNWRPDMLTWKALNEKFIHLNEKEKKISGKNISYWIQIYIDWLKEYFDITWIFVFATFQQPLWYYEIKITPKNYN